MISSVLKEEGLGEIQRKLKKKTHSLVHDLKKDTSVARPESFMIEVTNLCNLKCITCAREYEYGKKMNKGSIDFEEFKKIIDEIAPFAKAIGLTGLGETLLYKRLPEAIDYIHSKVDNPDIFISTNANLPNTPEILEKIGGNINTVQISIDGVFDKYDEIRRNGDYNRFIENVNRIDKLPNVDYVFNMVVMKNNFEQMANVVTIAYENGIKNVRFNTFNLASISARDVDDYKLYTSSEFLNEYKKAVELAEKLDVDFESFFDFETKPGFKKCFYPWAGFYITWDGFLVPCCTKPFPLELNFGNVFENGVMNCLNSNIFRQFRKQWHRNETPNFCSKCHFIEIPKVDVSEVDPQNETVS